MSLTQNASPSVFRRCSRVVVTDVDSGPTKSPELVLLHLGTRRYYVLNGTARCIWNLLDGIRDLDAISHELTESYDVGVDRALCATRSLIEDLCQEQLAEPSSPTYA